MKNLSKKILKWCGWEINNEVEIPNKCVICIAPHTSNWDFVWGNLFNKAMRAKAHFFIKKEWFKFPLGNFMRALGGIPVDRSKKTSLTDQIAEEFKKHEKFQLGITPEGTRKYNPDWKKGFYFIAYKANVPIILATLDYEKKELGYKKIVIPSGNYEDDIIEIKNFYKNTKGKYPELFGI
jgi:1-acyl-sn-glycerol-3-phosphate acyltransferase